MMKIRIFYLLKDISDNHQLYQALKSQSYCNKKNISNKKVNAFYFLDSFYREYFRHLSFYNEYYCF